LPFPSNKDRVKQLQEGLQIIRPLTLGERVDFDGEHFSAHVEIFPKPFQGKIHVIGGGSNPYVVKRLCGYVDEWNLFYSSRETYLKLKNTFLQKDTKHDLGVIDSYMAPFILAESEHELEVKLRWYGSFTGVGGEIDDIRSVVNSRGIFSGTIEDFVQQVNDWRNVGVERIYFQVLNPDDMEMKDLLTETIKQEF
jgi:alkanesulfonate monooxygenase SsuD/methylene tetrahydromethanopterin reductase-like flavin-dependent oxidoreductase (luciferase family)